MIKQGLVFLLTLQMLLTAVVCLLVVWVKDNDQGTLPLTTWFSSTPFLLPLTLTIAVVFWIAMHIGLKYFQLWLVKWAYVGFSLALAAMWAYAVADMTCDPLIRIIKGSSNNDNNNNNNNNNAKGGEADVMMTMTMMWPLSYLENAGPEWIAEKEPSQGAHCVAYTLYTQKSQNIVTIAAVVCITAFIVPVWLAWMQNSSSARLTLFHSGAVVAILGGGVQVVLNEDKWDWLMINALLAAFAASAYLATCTVALKYNAGDNMWESCAWVYVQLILAY